MNGGRPFGARRSKPGEMAPSRRAAMYYMEGGVTLKHAASRYGVSHQTVGAVVFQIRKEQRDATPEDEVTC